MRLDLRTPLAYIEAPELDPFGCPPFAHEAAGEWLFCFTLNEAQSGRIDPQADCFLETLIFAGRENGEQGTTRLPAGLYLFTQQRDILARDECIALAIEQQKDGLWERLCLENRLYIRRLFEDERPVTQLLRPFHENNP